MTDRELLEEIHQDLKDIKASLNIQTSADSRQWSALLLHEYALGADMDGNGLIFGHNFLFNQTLEFLPPSIRGLQNEYAASWKGKRLSTIEYIKTLPEGDLKDQVIKWQEVARERN